MSVRSVGPIVSLLAFVLAPPTAAAPPGPPPPRVLQHLSDTAGSDAELGAEYGSATPDGRSALFSSQERLLPSDTDSSYDVYAWMNGRLVHLSDDPTGPDDETFANGSDISPDGKRVLFSTPESLAPTDTDGNRDAYLWTPTGLTHVTDTPGGPDAATDGAASPVSLDLTILAVFTAEALLPADADTVTDAYVWRNGVLSLVSDNPLGPDGAFPVNSAQGSRDGRIVFFGTEEVLAPTDGDASRDVYARTPTGLVHVSDTPSGADPAIPTNLLQVSTDGRRALLLTDEALLPSDTDNNADHYLWETGMPLRHISDTVGGADAAVDAEFDGASTDLRQIIIRTTEPLMASDTDNRVDGYRWMTSGLQHVTDGGAVDAAEFAFPNTAAMEQMDFQRIFFNTEESMSPLDTDTAEDTYEWRNGAVTLLTDTPDPDADMQVAVRGASPDGSRLYIMTAAPLLPADTDTKYDLYERAMDGPITLVTDTPGAPDANTGVEFQARYIAAGGGRLFVETAEPWLPTDTDTSTDLYVFSATCRGQPVNALAPATGGRVRGNPWQDVVLGSERRDVVLAGRGNDLVCGLGGPDRLVGAAGKDRLIGGRGRDRLLGGRARDVLLGGPGRDTCIGGKGPDTLRSCATAQQ